MPTPRLAALVALIMLAHPAAAEPQAWTSDQAGGRVAVSVWKRGLLSGLAHDHHLLATAWRATARTGAPPEGAPALEVVVQVASLREQQPALSPEDRAKVEAQARQTLEADRFPEIRFTAPGPLVPPAAGAAALEVQGTLTLHGQARPLTLPIQVDREGPALRVRGLIALRQRDFGLEPFSGFLGTIAVKDEVEVAFELLLRPER